MTKGNVLRIMNKIGSSPNLETVYIAGEEISSIASGSRDEISFYDVKVRETHLHFTEKEHPGNYKAVKEYLKKMGQFTTIGNKEEDSNPLVV
jgi:hypothetical protein